MTQVDGKSAGPFSRWLDTFTRALRDNLSVVVDCGGCTACCRNKSFIQIAPEESETRAAIPRELLFPAPGLPEGYYILGYDTRGHCPMLVDNRCVIYARRPRTCRIFDCRVLTAAGISVTEDRTSPVDVQAARWQFVCSEQEELDSLQAIKAAAAYIQQQTAYLPEKWQPGNAFQTGVLAVVAGPLFLENSQETDPLTVTVNDLIKSFERFEESRTI